MTTVRMHVRGVDDLLRKLKTLDVEVSDVLETACHAGAAVIVAGANQRAPAPEIRAETVEKKKDQVTVDAGPPDEKWDWKFLETGAQPHEIQGDPLAFVDAGTLVVTARVDHPGMAAQPFMRPAFDTGKGKARDEVGDVIKETVEGV